MLIEDGLLLLVILVACTLLIVGILDLIWPTRPRDRTRRREAPAAPAVEASADPAAQAVADPAAAQAVAPESAATGAAEASARQPVTPETVFGLYEARRFAEVVREGAALLEGEAGEPSVATRSHGSAALWSVVGLAKQALGDHDGAWAALEAARDRAAAPDRPIHERQLAVLTLDAARARLARADNRANEKSPERVGAIREAIAWLERGRAGAPGDVALEQTLAMARSALWPACEDVSKGLMARQEWEAARRLLGETLADPKFPRSREAGVRDLLSAAVGGEIGQLTALAVRSLQQDREAEAFELLQRAEELLTAVPGDALSRHRRQDLVRRLGWGYAKLGIRRAEAGQFEAALEPLFRARRFGGGGADRQEEVQMALVKALQARAAAGKAPAEGDR
ncbi:MAG: hypothetical protein HY727_21970 [Candidatus Rokubacteria bacterium]|nr:hypothetical protein [Candidatus Rokubacteria bacterium]